MECSTTGALTQQEAACLLTQLWGTERGMNLHSGRALSVFSPRGAIWLHLWHAHSEMPSRIRDFSQVKLHKNVSSSAQAKENKRSKPWRIHSGCFRSDMNVKNQKPMAYFYHKPAILLQMAAMELTVSHCATLDQSAVSHGYWHWPHLTMVQGLRRRKVSSFLKITNPASSTGRTLTRAIPL